MNINDSNNNNRQNYFTIPKYEISIKFKTNWRKKMISKLPIKP